MERFFTLKQSSVSNRLNILDGVFEGRAKVWYEAQTFSNYEDLKKKFLNEFFLIPIRVKVKSAWLAKKFNPSTDQLASYFLNQIKEAQYFSPIMEKYELHYTIIQQLPYRIRELMATIDYNDFNKILNALSQLDLTFSDKQSNTKINHGNRNDAPPVPRLQEDRGFKPKVRELQSSPGEGCGHCNCVGGGTQGVVSSAGLRTGVSRGGNLAHNWRERVGVNLPDMRIPPPSHSHFQVRSCQVKRNHLNF